MGMRTCDATKLLCGHHNCLNQQLHWADLAQCGSESLVDLKLIKGLDGIGLRKLLQRPYLIDVKILAVPFNNKNSAAPFRMTMNARCASALARLPQAFVAELQTSGAL
jgi:hypothetical protein